MKAHSHTFQEWLHIYGHRSQPFPVWLRFSGPLEPLGKPLHCFCKIKNTSQLLYNRNYSDNISNIQMNDTLSGKSVTHPSYKYI